jgi:ribosome-binding protein aMBF1 (putative translation factor)
MTPAQCRAAREIADMSQFELAGASLVPTFVIIDYEAGAVTPQPVDLKAIRRALKAAGVKFTNGGQPVVRLKK